MTSFEIDAVRELHDAHEVAEDSDECVLCGVQYPCRARDWSANVLVKLEAASLKAEALAAHAAAVHAVSCASGVEPGR